MKEYNYFKPYSLFSKSVILSTASTSNNKLNVGLTTKLNNNNNNIENYNKISNNKIPNTNFCYNNNCNNNKNNLSAAVIGTSLTVDTSVVNNSDTTNNNSNITLKLNNIENNDFFFNEDNIDLISDKTIKCEEKEKIQAKSSVPLIWQNNFSLLYQQQQFAFFPNASEKVMANTRRIIVLSMYALSLV